MVSKEGRVLVACVGNVLRSDDGFGPAVASRLVGLPPNVELLETGIGGIALLQELLVGCDGLVVVDALDRGEPPGTVLVLRPEVAQYDGIPDMHLATPERVLSLARGMDVLPERLLLVGCQVTDAETVGQNLSAPVARAVPAAADAVLRIVHDWCETV